MNFKYFINSKNWKDANRLLEMQISQRGNNRSYNTLNFHYFEKVIKGGNLINTNDYFKKRVASSLFYLLSSEFFSINYKGAKSGLGLRKFTFFSFPLMCLYYSIGLYIHRLTRQLLIDEKDERINSYYGAGLTYYGNNLIITKGNIYYSNYYRSFDVRRKSFDNKKKKNRVIIRLDIQNYYEDISFSQLLSFLQDHVKPSIQSKYKYDATTIDLLEECLCFFFKNGVPQGQNNIISGFIGFLYLHFGDMIIKDTLESKKYTEKIEEFAITRYVDDIFVAIDFKSKSDNKPLQRKLESKLVYEILDTLKDSFYDQLGLRFNKKTNVWHPHILKESKDFKKTIRNNSGNYMAMPVLVAKEKKSQETPNLESTKKSKPTIEATTKNKAKSKVVLSKKVSKSESESNMLADFEELFAELEAQNKMLKADKFIEEITEISKINSIELLNDSYKCSTDNLNNIYSIIDILKRKDFREKALVVLKNFNYNLIDIRPKAILTFILTFEEERIKFEEFLLNVDSWSSKQFDYAVLYLNATNFQSKSVVKKMKRHSNFNSITNHFNSTKMINRKNESFYDLKAEYALKLRKEKSLIDQIRFRRIAESNNNYSLALNHLLNEIHFICCLLAKGKMKTFESADVISFLKNRNIENVLVVKTRNLFDRRNNNTISHPGDSSRISIGVSLSEYEDYKLAIWQVMNKLLKK